METRRESDRLGTCGQESLLNRRCPRRKTLRRVLANRYKLRSEAAAKLIAESGFTEDVRAEEIDLHGYVTLGKVLRKFVSEASTQKDVK